MKAGKAIFAGIVGGIAMTLLAWLGRSAGLTLDGETMLGTMLGNPPGPVTWLLGFGMHLVLSALIALVYAAGFEYATQRASAGLGLGFSLIHIVVAGLFMAMIPAIHPMVPEQMPAPGAFLVNMGTGNMALFIVEHLLYGSIVGGLYGAVLHPRVRPAVA